MSGIIVHKQKDTDGGWVFEVAVEYVRYRVTLEEEYWQGLTGSRVPPEKLVEHSFAFLLKREPKEAIFREFTLSTIQKHFPEYESEIKHML